MRKINGFTFAIVLGGIVRIDASINWRLEQGEVSSEQAPPVNGDGNIVSIGTRRF
jgi:hypothetical protein